MKNVGAVVVAAGRGSRMGTRESKQYLQLGGKPVIIHTLEVFQAMQEIDTVVLVAGAEDAERCRRWCGEYGLHKVRQIVAGGADRQQSVYNGLRALSDMWGTTGDGAGGSDAAMIGPSADCAGSISGTGRPDSGIVLIHDGVRPFVQPEHILHAIAAASHTGAAVLAVPVTDTIKQVDGDGFIESTPDRRSLWAIQTPQAFRLSEVLEAHRAAAEAGFAGTDDSMLVERLGKPVQVVEGSYSNRKLTTPEDLVWAQQWLDSPTQGRDEA